jgi:hypothetical protein
VSVFVLVTGVDSRANECRAHASSPTRRWINLISLSFIPKKGVPEGRIDRS